VSPTRKKSLTVAAFGTTVLAVSMLGLPSQAATSGHAPGFHSPGIAGNESAHRTPQPIDARDLGGKAAVKATRSELNSRSAANTRYLRSLGPQGLVSYDTLTGTPRNLGRMNGYLSGKSSAPARAVALSFVRSHLSVLGLKSSDLKTLRFRQDYVDTIGVHNLSWTQSVRGVPVFGNGLKVKVTRDGRVLSVQGSPVSGLTRMAAQAPTAGPVSSVSARTMAARNVGGKVTRTPVVSSRGGFAPSTVWANHDYSSKVWFLTPAGLRPGWSTYVQSSAGSYQHVIDAVTGRVLFRQSTQADANGDAFVYDNFPGAAKGGKAKVVNFIKKGWLAKNATFLNGSSVVAWSDVNDDNLLQNTEKTKVPGNKNGATFPLQKFGASASGFCKTFVCTWNPNVAESWKTNRNADGANAFYLASNFHDYLAQAPIGFTPQAGNFSSAGGDPVLLNAIDGAATGPDGNHIDNANMSTPPDGFPPTMQMYLWHFPGTSDDPATGDPFVPTSGAFDASILYHEYTHGLSNRLVIDADGNGALNSIQPGSMGEAWSDYYALDYLVTKGLLTDTAKAGQLLEGSYVAAGEHLIRTMAIDCAPTSKTAGCTSGKTGLKGGYTYGDFPSVDPVRGPEVHASGEIWGQTLWDLRTALGHNVADTLITRAMSLSPVEPSFLDMRNAIMQADLVRYGQAHTTELWKIFAARGMGYFAGAADGSDAAPAEDFNTPPAPQSERFTLSGTVTDPTSGSPVEGAVVRVAGLGDQFSAVTDGTGGYSIPGMFAGTYPKVVASGPGFFGDVESATVPQEAPLDFSILRDWAASSGGASVVAFNGPNFAPQCPPGGAIDLSLGTGWGSTTGDDAGTPTNVFIDKHIVVDMKQPIDISTFGVDPNATCGDPGSSSTGAFEISTSTVGPNGPWTTAATGTFVAADRGRLNEVPLTAGDTGVRWVMFTMKGNQVPDFTNACLEDPTAFGGCTFTDLSEFAVFGTPAS
jgi:extracellular elastinolytic metalloproteinase